MTASIAALLQEAMQLHRQGLLPDAERFYRAALARQPDNFDALHLLGMLAMQQGRLQEAADLAAAAVKRNPASAEALTLMGSIMLAQKHTDRALGYFDRAVVAKPGHAPARLNRAGLRAEAGQWSQALADYDQAVATNPAHAEAWFARGNTLAQLGRYREAVESYDRVLALAPNAADAHSNRGSALALLGQQEQANASYERALALDPDHGKALVARGKLLHAMGRFAEAVASFDRAIALKPDDAELAAHRAASQREVLRSQLEQWGINRLTLEQPQAVLADAQARLAVDPDDAGAEHDRANALLVLGRDEEAIAAYERTLALRPDYAEAHFNLAAGLQAVERHADAIVHFDRAMQLRPEFRDARWNASLSYLCLGRFAEGWDLYEERWAPHLRTSTPRAYPQPRWDGQPMPGVLLAWNEQGLGDQVLQAGVLSLVAPRVGRIVLEVDGRMVGLFARSFPAIEVVACNGELYRGRVDAQSPMGGLLQHVLRGIDDIPRRERGYLLADAQRMRQLRERIGSDGRRAIGLSWISRNANFGQRKSAELRQFEALLRMPGCRFIDLQYGDTQAERDAVERELGVRIERFADIDNTNDIDGLSALICACDAVLSVSNTTAHLAGALGVPTWVMVPFGRGHFWYWFADRPTSPWYPRVQVRRQGAGRSWGELVASLAPELVGSR